MRLMRHLLRCRHSFRLRHPIIMSVLLLLMFIMWPASQLLSGDGFPYKEFAARWNASPHCTGRDQELPVRRIHLMYQTDSVPVAFANYIRSWARDYPNFELHFWTDAGIDSFLMAQFGPRMRRFFHEQLAHGVERSDLARLLILNHFGGLYADLDVMSLRPAQSIMAQHDIVFTEEPRPHAIFLYGQPSLISNALIYSAPCRSFWRHFFLTQPARLWAEHGGPLRLWRRRWQRHRAVFATGPVVLDSIARKFLTAAASSI
uniref:Glycosyl transferase n=1 Tax=Macrostomum lignano TaxID=282301 RepID=A0A1I8HVV5_9PLAT